MRKKVILREAQDSYHALLIANGMQNAGADVFSVLCNHQGYYEVFCRHDASAPESNIDIEITKEVNGKAGYYEVA